MNQVEKVTVELGERSYDIVFAALESRAVSEAFAALPQLHLNAQQTVHYRNGVKLGLSQLKTQLTGAQQYAVYGEPDGFLGTAAVDGEQNCLRVERNLCAPKQM